jgi:hypothetical protein
MIGRWAYVLIDCDLVMNRCILGELEVLPILLLTRGLSVRKILVVVVFAHKILDRSLEEKFL